MKKLTDLMTTDVWAAAKEKLAAVLRRDRDPQRAAQIISGLEESRARILDAKNRGERPQTPDELVAEWRQLLFEAFTADPEAARQALAALEIDHAPQPAHNTAYVAGGSLIQGGNFGTVNNTFNHGHSSARDPGAVEGHRGLGNLPPPERFFTGREAELTAIDRLLSPASDGASVAVLGLGGIGKSSLVKQFAHTHCDRYQLMWWVTADRTERIASGLASMARRLHAPLANVPEVEQREWALRWLQDHREWLLVLDDASGPEDIQELVGQLGHGHVVITSRRGAVDDADWSALCAGIVSLAPLDQHSSVRLLTRRLADQSDPDTQRDAVALAEELGRLPLALALAGAYLGPPGIVTIAHYLDLMKNHPGRYTTAAVTPDPYSAINTALQPTLTAVAEHHPDALRLLRVLSCLASEALPTDALVLLADRRVVHEGLQVLNRYRLIDLSEPGAAVHTHQVVQDLVRRTDPDGDRTLEAAVRMLLAALPSRDPLDHLDDWPRWRALVSHVQAAALLSEQGGNLPDLLVLLNRTVIFLRIQGLDTRAMAQRAVGHLQRLPDAHDRDALTAWSNLACALRRDGKLDDAIRLFEFVARESIQRLDITDQATLSSYIDLGNAYIEAGRLSDAIRYLEPTAEQCEKHLGSEHPYALRSKIAKANAYFYRLDLRLRAKQSYEDLVPILERTFGPDHPDTMTVRGSLATVHEEMGTDPVTAVRERCTILDWGCRIFGEDHPRTLEARRALSRAHALANQFEQALRQGESAVEACTRVLGPHHPTTLSARTTLAFVYHTAGLPTQAAEVFREVLADRLAVLGPSHPLTLSARTNLTKAVSATGDVGQALCLAQEAYAECDRALGREHVTTLEAHMNLGAALCANGGFEQAWPILRQARDDAERVLGPQHPIAVAARAAIRRVEARAGITDPKRTSASAYRQ